MYNKRSQERTKAKPSNYNLNTSGSKRCKDKLSPIPKLLANQPKVGIQAKNASILSKNSSMLSDKKHNRSKHKARSPAYGKIHSI